MFVESQFARLFNSRRDHLKMRFEERELKSYAEPVQESELTEGSVYFSLNFLDEEMLIPTMETVVFIGRNLEPDDVDQVYFQDAESFERGARKDGDADEFTRFYSGSKNEVNHIFEYEHALDQLMACLLRRQKSERESSQ